MQLVLDTRGLVVRQRNGCFQIQTEKHERLIGTQKLSSILITTQCVLTTSAIRLAVQHKIPIYFLDAFGNVEAQLWSASFGHLSTLRRKQVLFAEAAEASHWVIELFKLKLAQQLSILKWLQNRKIAQKQALHNAIVLIQNQEQKFEQFRNQPLKANADDLMGIEGFIARTYWQCVSACLPEAYQFPDRNRHPATDAFNAAINYLYGMLYTVVETAIFSVGLDPYLGILHADQYDKPTLSYDMIEPFRAWADETVIQAFMEHKIEADYFEQKGEAMLLGKKGKQFFIPLFNTYLNEVGAFRNTKTTRKNHIYRFSGELVETLKNFG